MSKAALAHDGLVSAHERHAPSMRGAAGGDEKGAKLPMAALWRRSNGRRFLVMDVVAQRSGSRFRCQVCSKRPRMPLSIWRRGRRACEKLVFPPLRLLTRSPLWLGSRQGCDQRGSLAAALSHAIFAEDHFQHTDVKGGPRKVGAACMSRAPLCMPLVHAG